TDHVGLPVRVDGVRPLFIRREKHVRRRTAEHLPGQSVGGTGADTHVDSRFFVKRGGNLFNGISCACRSENSDGLCWSGGLIVTSHAGDDKRHQYSEPSTCM